MTTIPPSNVALERAVLGAVFHSAEAGRALRDVPPEVFTLDRHHALQRVIGRLMPGLNGRPPDLALVSAAAVAAGTPLDAVFLAELHEAGLLVVDVDPYLVVLRELAAQREEHAVAAMVSAAQASGQTDGPNPALWRAVQERLTRAQILREPTAAAVIRSATIGEILACNPVDLQTTYIVTPWIPRVSINALSAKAGVGKGKLTQDLVLARASGGTWLGLPVEPGPALFWSGEQGQREDYRVTQAFCRGRGLRDPSQFPHYFDIIYDPALRFGHPAMVADVRERLAAHPGLLIGIDSQRRAFEGEENDSGAADTFFRTVLLPLRAAGATTLMLAHPPKTGGQQKTIADENMLRGSGDWLAQLDSFLVLRPIERTRQDRHTETVTMRLIHVKPRSGPQADPMVVTLHVTNDLLPTVTFRLTGVAAADTTPAAEVTGATLVAALLFEDKKRLSRTAVLAHLQTQSYGRVTGEAALQRLLELGVIAGPLPKEAKHTGERGHWYRFLKPLPPPDLPPADPEEPLDDPDDD